MRKNLDLKALLFRVSEGDEDAFKVLFCTYCDKINSFASRLTGSDTLGQETVQEVFMKIWLGRMSLNTIDNFDAYVFTIVRNHVYNILRRRALEVRARIKIHHDLVETTSPEEEDILTEQKQRLREVIEKLPAQQRRVVHLCQLQGLKYQEAAELLNISQLTVKTHMQQALRTIRGHLSRLIVPVLGIIWVF